MDFQPAVPHYLLDLYSVPGYPVLCYSLQWISEPLPYRLLHFAACIRSAAEQVLHTM